MRELVYPILLAAALPGFAHATKDLAPFSMIQERCVAVGDISFGPGARWPSCRVTRARWYATLVADNLDFYQAQYCLGEAGGECEARALLLFSNRAYTPVARLVGARIDPPATRYDDPQVYHTDSGYIAQVTAHSGGDIDTGYFLWQAPKWNPIKTPSWARSLAGGERKQD